MRSTWTDSRLDTLNEHVASLDHRVGGLERSVASLDGRVGALEQRVDDLGRRMDAGFDRVDGELHTLRVEIGAFQRTMIQIGGGLIGTLAVGICGLIATQL